MNHTSINFNILRESGKLIRYWWTTIPDRQEQPGDGSHHVLSFTTRWTSIIILRKRGCVQAISKRKDRPYAQGVVKYWRHGLYFQRENSGNSALSGVRGLKLFPLRNLTQVERRPKDWITKRPLHGPLQHRNSPTDEPIQDAKTDLTQSPALFRLSFSLAEHSIMKIS